VKCPKRGDVHFADGVKLVDPFGVLLQIIFNFALEELKCMLESLLSLSATYNTLLFFVIQTYELLTVTIN
jgi:hypothetical protein